MCVNQTLPGPRDAGSVPAFLNRIWCVCGGGSYAHHKPEGLFMNKSCTNSHADEGQANILSERSWVNGAWDTGKSRKVLLREREQL